MAKGAASSSSTASSTGASSRSQQSLPSGSEGAGIALRKNASRSASSGPTGMAKQQKSASSML